MLSFYYNAPGKKKKSKYEILHQNPYEYDMI